jgi:hypothetical protein
MATTKEEMVDLKPKAEKITTEELKKLNEIVSSINALHHEVGKLEAQKHVHLHRLASVRDEAVVVQSKLEEIYGTSDININDGTINYPKDEK